MEMKNMNIIRKARGTELQRHQQRIFISWDIASGEARDEILNDLLSHDAGADCVVSYLESPGTGIDEDGLIRELNETQLLVLIVSHGFLDQAKESEPAEYRVAKQLNVPILPIAPDPGLFPEFTAQIGAIHGISTKDNEYRIKLREQLDNFLTSEDLMREINEKAFTGRLFLSYRKADIDEARSFMKKFHDLPGFEQYAIWYDNFLTAGRIFDEEIRASIDAADAFVLLVTPNLLMPGAGGGMNYVLAEEIPYALKAGKKIIAVEAVETDRTAFSAACPGVENFIPYGQLDRFGDHIIKKENRKDMTPERIYLIGKAFLQGIGVEKDFNRAISLLKDASEANHLDSLKTLASLCSKAALNENSLYWLEKMAIICQDQYGVVSPETSNIYNDIATIYAKMGQSGQAMELFETVYRIRKKLLGPDHILIADVSSNIGNAAIDMGDPHPALLSFTEAIEIYEQQPETPDDKLALIYNHLALTHFNLGNYDTAIEMCRKALDIRKKIMGDENLENAHTLHITAMCYFKMEDYDKSLEWNEKALAMNLKFLGRLHPDVASSYNNIANVYYVTGRFEKALENFKEAHEIFSKISGENHSDTLSVKNNVNVLERRLTAEKNVHPDSTKKSSGNTGKEPDNKRPVDAGPENTQSAVNMIKTAISTAEKSRINDPVSLVQLYHKLGSLYERAKDYKSYIKTKLMELKIIEKRIGKESFPACVAWYDLAVIYYKTENKRKALKACNNALELALKVSLGKIIPPFGVDESELFTLASKLKNRIISM